MLRVNDKTSERYYRYSYISSAVFQYVKTNLGYFKAKLTAKNTSRIFLSKIVPLTL